MVLAAITQLGRPETHRAIGRALGEPDVEVATHVLNGPLPAPLIEPDALAAVRDNAPFRDQEQPAWFALLSVVAQAGAEQLTGQSAGPVGYAALVSQADVYRGRVVTVSGKVRRIEAVTPAANDVGVDRLWRVTLEPSGGQVWPITVFTLTEPAPADEPYDASAVGVSFKKLSYRWRDGVGVTPVVLAERLETPLSGGVANRAVSVQRPPPSPKVAPKASPDVSFDAPATGSLGRSLLADLGVDLAALDGVVDQQRLLGSEAEVFYQTLGAVARTPATQLARLAAVGLPKYVERRRAIDEATPRDRQIARVLEKEQRRGRYSVAPLFGKGSEERGELIVVDAVVRRAVRIEATGSAAAAAAGVPHYYELEAFPEDSQNLPLVFVVRELPVGFPLGDAIRQPARLAGFFFKQWAYRTRQRGDSRAETDKRQFAPLLIGRAPIPLATPDASQGRPGLALGLLATAGLLGAVAFLWRQARQDRRYEATTLARVRQSEPRDFNQLASIENDSESE